MQPRKNFLISYLLCGPAVRLHDFTTYLSCSEILCINPYFTETASGPCKMFFVQLMPFLKSLSRIIKSPHPRNTEKIQSSTYNSYNLKLLTP